jgi:hypothetical protein
VTSIFVTFADGNPEMISAAERLEIQARSTGLFEEVLVLNDANLSDLFSLYKRNLEQIRKLDTYPLFYRASKAYALLYSIQYSLGKHQSICYMDAGNEIVVNRFSVRNLKRMISKAEQEGGLAEQLPNPEYEYSKLKLLEHMNPSPQVMNSGQVQATWFLMKVNKRNLDFASKWVELSNPDLNLWQNPTKNEPQVENFKEHRRDQSIFSILWKQSLYPTKPAIRDFRNICNASNPVQTRRNRSGKSEIKFYSNTTLIGFISTLFIQLRSFKNTLKTRVATRNNPKA